MSQAAAVIDLESYRRRREARATPAKPTPPTPVANAGWTWIVWVPVVWFWR